MVNHITFLPTFLQSSSRSIHPRPRSVYLENILYYHRGFQLMPVGNFHRTSRTPWLRAIGMNRHYCIIVS